MAWAAPTKAEVGSSLDQAVLPVLERSCFECHDDEMKKGDVSLERLRQTGDLGRHDIKLWAKVREQLKAGTMPPKKKDPLPDPDKQAVLQWIGQNEEAILAMEPSDPGPARARRLSREEYSNTLRDLLGIFSRPGEKFPADGSGGEGFTNNADTLTFSPLLIEKYLSAADEAIEETWNNAPLKQKLLLPVTSDKLPAAEGALLALKPFLKRAYRRQPTQQDLDALIAVFNGALQRGADWDGGMRVMFKAALVSPKFLFIDDYKPGATEADAASNKPRQLEPYLLASRLSYFLWSSMPDDTLLMLAGDNMLQNDYVLEQQVKRMLANDKAKAFIKNFTGQWFRFEELFNSVDPDRRKFPEFNDSLRQHMYDEVFQFCNNIFRQNGSVLDLLDSDYSYLNEPLAKLYGVPNVQGGDLREVKFADKKRGGLTGMAAILATTSYPQRTSPVLRGKWILEQVLGTPAPPPPPNVGQLPEDDRTLKSETLRQRLEAHRNKPACAGCHARLDPPGFALENFDPIGKWRDAENGKPLDTTGEMTGGRKFNTPQEFRERLMEDKDLFLRVVSTRLLGYALGRGVEIEDQPTVLRLEEVLRKNGYKSEALIVAVVKSYPFRWRR